MMRALRKVVGANADIAMIGLVVGILVVLFAPIPAYLLDFLIIANFSLAMLILLLTFYIGRPVEFSTFPSLLLVATLFRLSLNVAATRLILSSADGGKVIGAIGTSVVGGNYVIGLIVFIILVVVQYVVVTSGAQRVAEVAARFTLDSMPGQQMSIDADLNMGMIDQAEAQRRRKNIEREANFYGAMDGASKFVKGDAIAGIIILCVNIIGGLAIGVAQLGMHWADALRTFTLLTIGDGIVTQVPALVISVATGIIITRSAADGPFSAEVLRQIGYFPKALLLVGGGVLVFGFLPGIPLLPVGAVAGMLFLGAMLAYRIRAKTAVSESEKAGPVAEKGGADELYDSLAVDAIEVRVAPALIPFFGAEDSALMERIAGFRKQFAMDFGLVIPRVRIKDDRKLDGHRYQIWIQGLNSGEAELMPTRELAIHAGAERTPIDGIETRDPSYGLPAVWIEPEIRAAARSAGYMLVDTGTVFVTHVSETVKRNAHMLVTRLETERLVGRLRQSNPGLVEELVPNVLILGDIQRVLQNLLKEKVPIRNLELILEVLADAGRQTKDGEMLTEAVRQRLGPVICQSLAPHGKDLQVLTLDPAVEQTMASGLRKTDQQVSLVLEPRFAEQVIGRLAGQVERMVKSNVMPVLLCAPELRRHLRKSTERVLPHLAVVSMAEIPNSMNLTSFGTVTL